MSRILVTGGAGFIGSAMVRLLLAHDHSVRVLDKLTYAAGENWENLAGLNVELVRGDICSFGDCQTAMIGMDAVLHFAAESHVTRSENDPELFGKVNVGGTLNLLEAAFRASVERFLHISTDEVYGPTASGYFKEEARLAPTSPYASSKASADIRAQEWKDKIPGLVIARPTNNFGPRQHPEKAFPRWITHLLSGQKIPVWGEGRQVRDWLYAEDCCWAIRMLLEAHVSGVYNIGANNLPEITNLQMAKLLVRICGLGEDYIELVRDPRPDHDFRYGVNTDRIRDLLGWKPSWSLESAVTQTVEWYKQNESWWRKRVKDAEALYAGKEKPTPRR